MRLIKLITNKLRNYFNKINNFDSSYCNNILNNTIKEINEIINK